MIVLLLRTSVQTDISFRQNISANIRGIIHPYYKVQLSMFTIFGSIGIANILVQHSVRKLEAVHMACLTDSRGQRQKTNVSDQCHFFLDSFFLFLRDACET